MDKKIHRFLMASIPEADTFAITEEKLVHQLGRVLRMDPGDKIILFADNGPDVLVQIIEVLKKEIQVSVISTKENVSTPSRSVIVFLSVIRRERFEFAVEKLTELGVSEIVPLLTHRTVRESVRIDRLQAISDEALEQCGGNKRVKISEPISLIDSFIHYSSTAVILDMYGDKTITQLPEMVSLYIGPEGGWSKEDYEIFNQHQLAKLSLGPRVLRAETAAIVGTHTLLCL